MAATFVLVTIVLLIVALYSNWARPSVAFLVVIFIFLVFRILTPEEVLKGLANKQIAIIFLLVILVNAFRKSFGNRFFQYLFKDSLRPKQFLGRMMLFVCSISPFINNTPIVAFMIPYVKEWLDNRQWPVSKYMIPLCFATVMSGMITVIGTSSNLVLLGLISEASLTTLSYKDFLYLGVLVTLTGVAYLYTIGYGVLPAKKSATMEMEENIKEYVVETIVTPRSHLIGETVTGAHLRKLKDIYLFEINRKGSSISPVPPDEIICEGDQLFFSGRNTAIARLMKNGNGLSLPDTVALDKYHHDHCIEAIIPVNSSLIGKKVNETNFRKRFNATIIALHRQGKRVTGSIGESVLNAGDLLLLLGAEKMPHNSADLFLLKRHDVELLTPRQLVVTKSVTVAAVVLLVLGIVGIIDLFMAALVGILLFSSIKTLKLRDFRAAIDFDLALLLVASLAIGLALTKSGAAQMVATAMLRFGGTDPRTAIILLFTGTVLITAVISNTAAVAIVFPLAVALANQLHISTTPVFVSIAFAATCVFMTPIGYQCNLMVYGPGNYSFRDFFKVGFPLTILYTTTCILFIFWYYNL
ncbi:MAG TPA: SLC13 family permease [Flavisolibacter sp.]|jgi:di/tricarboxylate transporter|nr:SLC13 family permease [Flavisolibacter sp.]